MKGNKKPLKWLFLICQPRMCHLFFLSHFLILLVLQLGGRENREVKCTTAFSHVSCSKSHHTDTMRKKVLWCTSLLSLPYLLSCRNLSWGEKKTKKPKQKPNQKPHKKNPKQTLNPKVSPQSQPMISTGWRFHSRTEQVQGWSISQHRIHPLQAHLHNIGAADGLWLQQLSASLLPFPWQDGRGQH